MESAPLNVPSLGQISRSFRMDRCRSTAGRPNVAGPVAGLAGLMEQFLDSTGCPQQLLDMQKQARASPPVFASPQALHAALVGRFCTPRLAGRTRRLLSGPRRPRSIRMPRTASSKRSKKRRKPPPRPEKKPAQGKRSRVLFYLALAVRRPDGDWRRPLLDALRRPGARGDEPVGRRRPRRDRDDRARI